MKNKIITYLYIIYVIKLSFLFFYSFILVSIANANMNISDIVKCVKPALVTILVYNSGHGSPTSMGSGFIINKNGLIVTNYHVIGRTSRIVIKTSDGKLYEAERYQDVVDKTKDISILSINAKFNDYCVLTLCKDIPEVGEHVLVIGNPLGLEQTVSDGIVSALRNIRGFGEVIQTTAPISRGSSGGPVVNMKGEVIGVATFMMNEGQNLNFAIPVHRINTFLLSMKEQDNTKKSHLNYLQNANINELIRLGNHYLSQKSYLKAIDKYNEVIMQQENSTAYYNRAIAYYYIDEYNLAKDDLEKARKLGAKIDQRLDNYLKTK